MSDDGRQMAGEGRRARDNHAQPRDDHLRPTPDDEAGRRSSVAPRATRERQLITRLLVDRGVARHTLFLTEREGLELPDGVEAVSGFVLDDRGAVHGFWLAWDDDRGDYTLAPFYPVEAPERAFARDPEYQAARRTLGLV